MSGPSVEWPGPVEPDQPASEPELDDADRYLIAREQRERAEQAEQDAPQEQPPWTGDPLSDWGKWGWTEL